MASVVDVLTFRGGFNTSMVVAGTTLLGVAAGVVGVFALLRKRSLVADALSHATLPGLGVAFLVATWLGFEGRALPVLLAGATVSGVIGVLCIQMLLRYTRLREDAAIGIVLSVSFGLGVVILSYIQTKTSSSSAGLHAFIFGQAATMLWRDVMLMAAIALTAAIATTLFAKECAVVSFDAGFARVTGWPVGLIDLVVLLLIVLVTVAGLQAVGLVLVVAMLIIPPVSARFWTERLWVLMVLSGVLGGLSGYAGAVASALAPRLPAGAVIVLAAGGVFVLSLLCAPSRGVVASASRRARLTLRIAGEHLLESAYRSGDRTLDGTLVRSVAMERGWPRWLATVVRAVLAWRGFVTLRGRGGMALTSDGWARGARVCRNHALWEQYLISHADVAPNHVDWSVDQVEHVLSDALIGELETELATRGVRVPEGAPDGG